MTERPYDLLIFDWDGTLMDSAGQIVSSATRAIEMMGLPARRPEQISELIGLGLRDAFDLLFPEIPRETMDDLLVQYSKKFSAEAQPSSHLFKGVLETLEAFKGQGFELAVATGKSRRGLDRAMGESGLTEYFSITRCADESANKPDPQMLHDILIRTATEPHRALMVGDTEYDMAMAAQAEVPALAVACGVHEQGRLEEAGALDVLPSVAHMPEWLSTRA